jgi:hypothetical protein
LLLHCVAAISGAESFTGTLVPARMMHLIAQPMSEALRAEILHSARDIFWQAFWRRVYFRSDRLAQFLQKNLSLAAFLSKPTVQGRWFVYKEPFLCFAAEHFAHAFPQSKFIHIIRDGRDCADSMERTYPHALTNSVLSSDELSFNKVAEIGMWRRKGDFNFPWWIPECEEASFRAMSTYGRYIRLWSEMTSRARALAAFLPADRYLEIRYEALVQEPEAHAARLLSFLGASASKEFIRRLREGSNRSVRIAARRQSEEKLQEAAGIAGDLLGRLGYAGGSI